MSPSTPLAHFLPDAASLINEAVDVLRAIIRDATATTETRRRAAASLLHFLLPRPSARAQKTTDRATDSLPPPRGEVDEGNPPRRSRGEGLEQLNAPNPATDTLPLPLGEVEERDPPRRSRGEGHQSRALAPSPNGEGCHDEAVTGEECLIQSITHPTPSTVAHRAASESPVTGVALRDDSGHPTAPDSPRPETPNPKPDASHPDLGTRDPAPDRIELGYAYPHRAPTPASRLVAAAGSTRSLDSS